MIADIDAKFEVMMIKVKSLGEKFPTFSCGSGKLSFFCFFSDNFIKIDVFQLCSYCELNERYFTSFMASV